MQLQCTFIDYLIMIGVCKIKSEGVLTTPIAFDIIPPGLEEALQEQSYQAVVDRYERYLQDLRLYILDQRSQLRANSQRKRPPSRTQNNLPLA